MKVYHQAGHNTVWSIGSYAEEGCGDGVIFSPVHILKKKLEELPEGLKAVSLFDPQYYIPDSQKSRLNSYEFFPEKITKGFSTVDFEALAHQSASMCLDFQIENNFESIIVPARYFPELVSDYIEKQKAFTVEPFLAELEKKKPGKKVFLSLPVTTMMTQDRGYRQQLLNWITSYPEVDGVYLLNEFSESSKQISSSDKLQAHVDFIRDIQGANLKVIVGYCNTEAIVLTLLNPYALTIGAYENTRGFSIDKFLEEESDRRGPAPRLYFPKLLNWMRYATANEIRQDHPKIWEKIYTPTTYSEALFSGAVGAAHFTKSELYKHHYVLICEQIRAFAAQDPASRLASVKAAITSAKALHDEVEGAVMYFDRNCSGDHLPIWSRIVNKIGV